MFSSFKSDKGKKTGFVCITLTILVFFFFEYDYQFELYFGTHILRDVVYYDGHTIPALLWTISLCPFVIAVSWVLAKFADGVANWFKYFASLFIDTAIVIIWFAYQDPEAANWDKTILVLLSISLTIIKLILYWKWKRFRRMKIV